MNIQILIQKLIQSNDFFDNFTEDDIQELLKCCSSDTFKDKEALFHEGSTGNTFHIIISGSVSVSKKNKHVDIVKEGECIGEMGALSGEPRSATAAAIDKITVLTFDYKKIASLSVPVQAKLYKNIALLVSNRLRKRLGHVH